MPDQRVLPSRPAGLEHLCQRRVFPGRSTELGRLRRWLASLLPDAPARDDVVLVAVELATNAIKHTASGLGGYLTVEITCAGEPGTVRVTVTDGGAAAGPVWPASPDPLDGHGLGLQLVRALAARSGVSGDSSGRSVWAEMPWPSAAGEPAPTAAPAAGMNGHKTRALARQGRAGRSSLHVASLGTVDDWGRDDASRWSGFNDGPGAACSSWLAGCQQHPAMAATAADYAWVAGDPGVFEAYCLTLARGLTPEEFLVRLGARSEPPRTGISALYEPSHHVWSDNERRSSYRYDNLFIGVTSVPGDGGDWVLGVEINGHLG